jgi:hypothetical protein
MKALLLKKQRTRTSEGRLELLQSLLMGGFVGLSDIILEVFKEVLIEHLEYNVFRHMSSIFESSGTFVAV